MLTRAVRCCQRFARNRDRQEAASIFARTSERLNFGLSSDYLCTNGRTQLRLKVLKEILE